MRVAIMGAGLAGLACALTLEKHGISGDIFEKRNQVGDRFVNTEAMFNILNKPINNCLSYFDNEYGIQLSPISEINSIVIHSKNNVGTIEGNLGISNIRGRHKQSFENQLYRELKTKVHFNSQYDYETLKGNYDYIVLAPGDGEYALKLNNYNTAFTVNLKGVTVEGNFNPKSVSVWLNQDFVPKGYAYMIPYSDTEANITIAYPNYPENKERDINDLWNSFTKQAEYDLNQSLRVTDGFQITDYIIGRCKIPKVENTYFVGNCFGSIGPFLGFGQFIALLTGIYSAYDICGISSYEKETKKLFSNYENSLVLRKGIEKLDNEKLDLLVKSVDNRLLDNLINSLFSDNYDFDIIRWLSYLIRPIIN